MKIKNIELNHKDYEDQKIQVRIISLVNLFNELKNRKIPAEIIETFNTMIDSINTFDGEPKMLLKLLNSIQEKVLSSLEKELKLVTKNHYQNKWMAMGMAAFGIPIGAALGLTLNNMAFLGLGLPIGLAIGIAIGSKMDKAAKTLGNQLNLTRG